MQASPELGQVLVAAVAEHDWASPPSQLERLMVGLDPAEIVKASVCHGVAGCVHLSTSGLAGTDDQFRTALARAYQAAVASHLRTVAELGAIAPVLDAAGVPWAVVKGPVLSEAVYARPDLRDYVDLDLVVRPSGLGAALDALEDAGCVLLERNWRHLRSARPGEVALALPNGTRVDLHWHLLYHPSLRRQFSVPMDVILDRCRSVDIRGLAVRTLDPVDTVLALALHASLSGGHRLIWCKDIEQALRHELASWDDIVERSHAWRAARAVATMLLRARSALAVPVPDDVLAALAPRWWRSLVRSTQKSYPVQRATAMASPVRVVARAARDQDRSCGLELARGGTGWAWRRLAPGGRALTAASVWDEGRFHPVDHDGDRRAFLRAVADESTQR